jgi:hypothetical protein
MVFSERHGQLFAPALRPYSHETRELLSTFMNLLSGSESWKSATVTNVPDYTYDCHGTINTLLPFGSSSGGRVDRGLLRGLRQRGRHGL